VNDGQVIEREPFPHNLPRKLNIVRDQVGKAYSVSGNAGNSYALPVGGKKLGNLIREAARAEGILLRKSEIGELANFLQAYAEMAGNQRDVWYRVAPVPGGIEIDLGDEKHTHVRITAGRIEVVAAGSGSLFSRSPVSQPLVIPADVGNLDLLKKYLNLHALSQGQLDSLLENLLAAAVVEFAEDEVTDTWSGTPSELLAKLNSRAARGTQRSRDWPQNAIALSKRLVPLQASLLTQGIQVDLSRGKERNITIRKSGGKHD
jgi:hypothetical protein